MQLDAKTAVAVSQDKLSLCERVTKSQRDLAVAKSLRATVRDPEFGFTEATKKVALSFLNRYCRQAEIPQIEAELLHSVVFDDYGEKHDDFTVVGS